ncbi:TPA_asm: hypothetical protein GYZ54_08995 [Listeria monocytogenes]|nr:hypothetical protein [Listeria monocytogenes]
MAQLDEAGLHHENGWVTGNLLDNEYIINGVIESNDEYIAIESWCQIDKNTIGQFTGLTDKNGKKIFEGDIVTAFSNINKYTDSFAKDVEPTFCCTSIIFDGACFKTTYKGKPSYVLNQNGSSLVKHMEIVGNVHEATIREVNPELLEVAE